VLVLAANMANDHQNGLAHSPKEVGFNSKGGFGGKEGESQMESLVFEMGAQGVGEQGYQNREASFTEVMRESRSINYLPFLGKKQG